MRTITEALAHTSEHYTPGGNGRGNPTEPAPQRSPRIPHKIGARIPKKVADQIVQRARRVPDDKLRERIDNALLEKDEKGQRYRPVMLRRRKACRLLLDYLEDRGGFVRSQDNAAYYFHEQERRLFKLSTPEWIAWLYSIAGVNPASTDFAHLRAACDSEAVFAPVREIVKVSTWDKDTQTLRVSRFDGTVYVLDGETIAEEANGETVIFDDNRRWQPYSPVYDGSADPLNWSTTDLPNWDVQELSDGDDRARQYGLAFRVWWLSTFFWELCPTRPMSILIGERGGGKTGTLRTNVRFLFGTSADVSGVPAKPDDFVAAASASHILILDNLDDFTGWLRDFLARISTGSRDHQRQFYTNNELLDIEYRVWIGFTSRTPDTLRRDDLADRLLLLPVKRLENDSRLQETAMLDRIEAERGMWWGEVLKELNAIVRKIRTDGIPTVSKLRMADWEVLGRVIARVEDQEEVWDQFVTNLVTAQAGFLLEDDLIVEGLTRWMQNKGNYGKEVTASMLHPQLEALLFGDKKPPRDWSTTVRGFSRRLSTMHRELHTLWDVDRYVPTEGEHRRLTVYTFKPKDKPQEE